MPSVAERLGATEYRTERKRRNVGTADRLVSAGLGVAALGMMTRPKSSIGKALAATTGAVLLRRAATGRSRVYQATGISSASLKEGAGIDIESAITIMRPREELFEFWRDLSNLPLVMRHITSVEVRGDGTSRWVAEGPRGMRVEWDTRIINEERPEFIAWESLPGSDIDHAGSVHFTEAGEMGTELHLKMRYVPRGMELGFAVAKMLNPITVSQVHEDLRRFKHTVETGVDDPIAVWRRSNEQEIGTARSRSADATQAPKGAVAAMADEYTGQPPANVGQPDEGLMPLAPDPYGVSEYHDMDEESQ